MFNGTNVKILNSSDFDENGVNLTNNRCTFVLYYADWCGHCQMTKPEWIKFADMAQFIHVAAIDSDNEKNLIDKMNKNGKFKINGFPTILIYKNGKQLEEYNSDRTCSLFIKKAMKICSKTCKCHTFES